MRHIFTTICIQPWSGNVFLHMFIFQTRQFPQLLCWLDQWKCFVWSTKLWMFVKETWHVLVMWSACLTKLTTFFKVFNAWCHCDFRKMDTLKVNKSGQTYRTENRRPKLSLWGFIIFYLQLSKSSACETLHNDRGTLRETWLSPFSILVWRCCNWGQLFF